MIFLILKLTIYTSLGIEIIKKIKILKMRIKKTGKKFKINFISNQNFLKQININQKQSIKLINMSINLYN